MTTDELIASIRADIAEAEYQRSHYGIERAYEDLLAGLNGTLENFEGEQTAAPLRGVA